MSRDKDAILQELLVLRCKRGECQAFEDLFRLWEGRLLYYIRRLVAGEEDAWDVLQQTWMKVFKSIKSLANPRCLSPWLYKIARCTAISHRRSLYRHEAWIEEGNDLAESAACEDDCRFESAEQVHLGLSKLSVVHREVLTLFFLQDLSLNEIAEVLGTNPGTVKSRLFHAKRRLRTIIERREGNQ